MDPVWLFCWKLDNVFFVSCWKPWSCQIFFEVGRYSSKIIFILVVFAGRDVVDDGYDFGSTGISQGSLYSWYSCFSCFFPFLFGLCLILTSLHEQPGWLDGPFSQSKKWWGIPKFPWSWDSPHPCAILWPWTGRDSPKRGTSPPSWLGWLEIRCLRWGGTPVHPWKLTWHWKITIFNRRYIGLSPLPVTVANEGLGWDPLL